MTPLETALFWIKYVAATKGATHLQSSAARYNPFVFYNLDVWMFFIIVFIISTFILWKAIGTIIRFYLMDKFYIHFVGTEHKKINIS